MRLLLLASLITLAGCGSDRTPSGNPNPNPQTPDAGCMPTVACSDLNCALAGTSTAARECFAVACYRDDLIVCGLGCEEFYDGTADETLCKVRCSNLYGDQPCEPLG